MNRQTKRTNAIPDKYIQHVENFYSDQICSVSLHYEKIRCNITLNRCNIIHKYQKTLISKKNFLLKILKLSPCHLQIKFQFWYAVVKCTSKAS